nr:unnamed protein product [Callosobruchus analis]
MILFDNIITNLVARWPRSSHDVAIFSNSDIRQQFLNSLHIGKYLIRVSNHQLFVTNLIAIDSGYYLRPQLPLFNPEYNSKMFWGFKKEFSHSCIRKQIEAYTSLIVIVAAAIYNTAKGDNEEEPPDPENMEHFLVATADDDVPNIPMEMNVQDLGFHVRQELINDFGNLVE